MQNSIRRGLSWRMAGCVLAIAVVAGADWTVGSAASAVGADHAPVEDAGVYGIGPTPRRIAHDFAPDRRRMGPPPRGYWRLRPDPAPEWTDGQPGMPAPSLLPTWSFRGPRPIANEYWSGNANASGRVVSIAPHPTDPNIVYIGTASGGVWKTVDGGVNWAPLTDALPVLNHGAVALDKLDPNRVYAGTGEYSLYTPGDGLFRSLDAGATWTRIATVAQVGSSTSRVAIDPTNSNNLHVTTTAGYTRSTNGGATWTRVINGACSDLVVHPTTPAIVYVARSGDGIYRSINGGLGFSRLGGGLPAANLGQDRISVAIAPSNPSVMHASYVDAATSGLFGHYKSTDGGTTWSVVQAPDYLEPQGWYDQMLGILPSNENTVFAGGVFPYSSATFGVVRTTDGGTTWSDVTIGSTGARVHPDQHAIAFGPTGTVWVGSDGGVWRSDNLGQSWTNTNATLAVSQLYNIGLHPTNAQQIVGGTQDNGAILRTANDSWSQVLAGDGGFCLFDAADPTRQYITYIYLEVWRRTPSGYVEITGPWGSDPREFIAPLVADPSNSNVLLGGTNRVWRTQNASTNATWTAISPAFSSTLTALAVAPSNSNVYWAGAANGELRVSTDGGATWILRSAGLPAGLISDICIKPTDPLSAIVTFDNPSGNRVMRTTNGGVSWTSSAPGLPTGLSVKAAAIDWRFPALVQYVGTGAGVYVSETGGLTWVKNGNDLPNVVVGDLAIDRVNNTIVVATYGRGAYSSPMTPCGPSVAYGFATPGSVTPTITADGCANVGTTLPMPLTGPASGLGLVALGIAPTFLVWNGLTILQSMDATAALTLSAFGVGTFQLPIPANPALVNFNLYAQAAYLDASTPSGFCATRGLNVSVR